MNTMELALLIESAEPGAVIHVQTEARKELAEHAIARMKPGQDITVVVDNPVGDVRIFELVEKKEPK